MKIQNLKFIATALLVIITCFSCFASLTFEKKIETGSNSLCQRILCLSDSGYLITGLSESSTQSSIACRLNSAGDTLWLKKFGEDDFSLEAVEMNGSGYLIVGATQNSAGDQSSGVWKVDLNGNMQWVKIITPDTLGYSIFTSIKKIGSNYLIGGFADFGNIIGTGGRANTLVMIDSAGAVIWSKMYWVDTEYYSILSIKLTSDLNILVTGTAEANYAMKIDMSGNLLWAKKYSDGAFSSVEEINGSYYFFGFDSNSECLVTKTNSNGVVVWAKSYYNVSEPFQISLNYLGGLSLVASLDAFTEYQACVLEIDTNGTPFRLTSFVSASDDIGTDLKQTLDGGYIFSIQKNDGTHDEIGFIKTDSAMQSGCEISNALPITANLTLQDANFSPMVINTFYTQSVSLSVQSGGILNFTCNGSGLNEAKNSSLRLYPTISTGKFQISSNKRGILYLFNSLGMKIKKIEIGKDIEINIDITGTATGIYLYKVIFDDNLNSESGKFVVD